MNQLFKEVLTMRRVFAALFVLVIGAQGCHQSGSSVTTSSDKEKGRLKVHAPGVDVDIERDKGKKHVDVDVQTK